MIQKSSVAGPMGRICFAAGAFFLAFSAPPRHASAIVLLHEFAGAPDDVQQPRTVLALSGSTLFGTTDIGRDNLFSGAIFSVNTDGTAYSLLHEFGSEPNAPRIPLGELKLNGSVFFGTTFTGGAHDMGTVYSINTDGSGFRLLHEFDGNNGEKPYSGVTQSGTTLYGTTGYGGRFDRGTVYSINTDGTNFNLLHEFAGAPNDGYESFAGLTLLGSTLYSTSDDGGERDLGTVYAVNTDGGGFNLLYEFSGGIDDGWSPNQAVTPIGSTLFGVTNRGGQGFDGTLFSINTDGSNYKVLHRFTPGPDNGWLPTSGLTLSGTTLYGTTARGGRHDRGTVYSINPDGSDFTLIHHFVGGPDDGQGPIAGLTISGPNIFGTTNLGGDYDRGTVFWIQIPEPSPLILTLATFLALAVYRARSAFSHFPP
jgi:uncharacterized repeat protein (TIGR03803 family)